MIIPIKCFTCGKVLANKYRYYQQEVRRIKSNQGMTSEYVTYLDSKENRNKTPEGELLDQLQLHKMCCRRHMITHVDIE